jgi:putative tributyrin esterase
MMSLIPVPFFSSALYARKTCLVYVPAGYETSRDRHYPVIYLLHGMYNYETDWTLRGDAHKLLDRLIEEGSLRPSIVVMPNDGGYGHGTFYTDWYDGTGNFEQYIIHDLVPFIDSELRTVAERSSRVIAGYSMGGFGAVSLALRNPDLFGAAASLSGALGSPEHFPYKDYARSEFPRIFGPAGGPYAKERDLLGLAARMKDAEHAPSVYADCGIDDSLLPFNRGFHQALMTMGYPHVYHEFPGGHDFDYWKVHLEDALRFMEDYFQGKLIHK